jgi:hypothetical protein
MQPRRRVWPDPTLIWSFPTKTSEQMHVKHTKSVDILSFSDASFLIRIAASLCHSRSRSRCCNSAYTQLTIFTVDSCDSSSSKLSGSGDGKPCVASRRLT